MCNLDHPILAGAENTDKNALPTFVRAMPKTFMDLIRDIIEVYVDDIVVKIKVNASLLDNLALVFDRLRSMRTKMNLNKCVFGVSTRASTALYRGYS
jgi:hypothetical protein